MAELVSEHDWVLRQTLSDGHPVHGHLRDAVEVDKCRRDHKHMEYLVTLELYVHFFSGESNTVLRGGKHFMFKGGGLSGIRGVWKIPHEKRGSGKLVKYRRKIVRFQAILKLKNNF